MYEGYDLVFSPESHRGVLRISEVVEYGANSPWITVMAQRITKQGIPDKRDELRPRQRSFWHSTIIEVR